MYRADTTAGAPFYALVVLKYGWGSEYVDVFIRSSAGAALAAYSAVIVPYGTQLRIARVGNTYAGYYSSDGTTWNYLTNSGANVTTPLPQAGLFVLSNTTAETGVGFSHVNFTPSVSACVNGWNCYSVGQPTLLAGGQTNLNSSWQVYGSGASLGGRTDQFNEVYQTITGDTSLTASVDGQDQSLQGAEAGLMYRADTTAGAPFYALVVTKYGWGNENVSVLVRPSAGAVTGYFAVTVPYGTQLRIARQGNVYAGYYSTDLGTTWNYLTNSGANLTTPLSQAGLFVLSNTAAETGVSFSHVNFTPSVSACVNGWSCYSVGQPTLLAGGETNLNGSWQVYGSGASLGGSTDQFNEVYQTISGDTSLTASVDGQDQSLQGAEAGLMYRADTTAGAPFYALVVLKYGWGSEYVDVFIRSSAGAALAAYSAVIVPYGTQLRIAREGNAYAGYYSSDGTTWNYLTNSGANVTTPLSQAGLFVLSNTTAETGVGFSHVAYREGLPTDQARCAACQGLNANTGGPINTRSGNLWTEATDLSVSSPGPALVWTRAYNSQATGDADQPGALGYGWSFPYSTHLVTSAMPGGEPGVAIVVTGQGNRLRFVDLGTGQYTPYANVDRTLVHNGDGTYTETMRDQSSVIFNAAGQATDMLDGHGGHLRLNYNGSLLSQVIDVNNASRYLTVDPAADGIHIGDVKDPQGRKVQYIYGPNSASCTTSDLCQVIDVMGRTVTHKYNNHLLTEIDNNLGQPEEQTSYDQYTPAGKATNQTLQDGTQLSFNYQPTSTTVTKTGAGSTPDVTVYNYDQFRNTLISVVHNGITVSQAQFDGDLAPSQTVDGDNNTTQIVNNAMGLPTSVTSALGQTSSVQYDTLNRPITSTDTLGRQTALTYDANNNLIKVTSGITTTTTLSLTTLYTYTTVLGNQVLQEQKDPSGVVTHYDYNTTTGLLTDTIVGYGTPLAQTTGYGYDASGRVTSVTTGMGTPLARTDMTYYNADNTIAKTILNYKTGTFNPAYPDQDVTTVYGYDALGRPAWTKNQLGIYNVVHYNVAGQVDWTLKNLSPVTLDGNGNPIIPSTPPTYLATAPISNVASLYGYDGLGRTMLVTQTGILTGTFNLSSLQFAGTTTRTTKIDYDTLNRPITTTYNLQSGLPVGTLPDVNLQTVTKYDNAGNVTWQRDALGRWTQTLYDALNRPYETIKNYENGNPLTVDPANTSWTDGTDTDLISYTNYQADSSVGSSIENWVNGTFTATQPITDTITQYGYDQLGRQTTLTQNYDPSTLGTRTDTNRVTTTQYDPVSGLVTGTQDALGRWASLQYDALARVSTSIQNCTNSSGTPLATGCAAFDGTNHPDRNVPSTSHFDALGRVYETVDALGHVTHTDFDGLGRAIDVIQNDVSGGAVNSTTNVKTQTAYDALGHMVSTTDADGKATTYSYDGLDDQVSATDPMTRTTQMGYDGTSTLRFRQAPNGQVTVYNLDGLGRVVSTIVNYQTGSSTAPDQDLTTSTQYDAAGRTLQTTDPAGVVTAYSYDLLDRQKSVTHNVVTGTCSNPPCNVVTQYQYDRVGNKLAAIDPLGHARHWSYDAANEQLSAADALNRSTSWDYDLGGRVTAQTDPRGSADNLTYSYDGLDRVTQTAASNLPGGAAQASYDALGERLSLTDATGSTSFQYDPLGRISQVQAPATGTVQYGYDANGQRTSLTYPDATQLSYQYWPDGQLQTASQGSTTLASYAYDSNGRLASVARSNGTTSSYQYDGANRLTDLHTTAGSTLVSDYSYQPDRLGQTTVVTETVAAAGGTPATPTFVQAASAVPQTPQTTVTVTYASAQTAGNTNILAIGWNDTTSTISAVTDSAGNTYQVAAPLARGNGFSQAIYYAKHIVGSCANTITVTFNQPAPYVDLRALEYSGLDATAPFDSSAAGSGTGTLADSGPATTHAANELLVGAGVTLGTFSGAGSGYTTRVITNPDADIAEDQVVSVAGTYHATAPVDQAWVMQVATFRAAGSAPTNPTPTFVQVASAVPQTPQTTVSVTYASAQTAGNTNILAIGWNDTTSTISAVTDSAGNTYQVAAPTVRGSDTSQAIYYAANITGGANTVTVTFNQAAAYVDLRSLEYSGLRAASPLDGAASASGSGGTAGSCSSTSAAGDLLVGAGMTDGGFSGAGSGYTTRIITNPDIDLAEDTVAGSAGSYSATAPVVGNWVMQLAAFKAAPAGTSGTTTNRTVQYSYDGLRRLVGAVESPGSSFAYGYDLAGNRTSVAVNGSTTASYSYDAADQVVGWTYDAAGNLTSDGVTTYSYDALNHLTGTTATGQTRAYSYNGDGTLVSATANGTTTSYTQDLAGGLSQVLAGTSGSTTTDYLYGQDRLASLAGGVRIWYGADGQGSVRQTLSDSSVVLSQQNFDPYGQPEGSLGTPFGYTGELQDSSTGREYLRARWYQPGMGTLLAVDPLLGQTGQPYSYASDNPVNGSDPSGQCTDGSIDLGPAVGGRGNCARYIDAQIAQQGGQVEQAYLHNAAGINAAINLELYAVGAPGAERQTVEGFANSPQGFEEFAVLNGNQLSESQIEQDGSTAIGELQAFEAKLQNPGAVVSSTETKPRQGFLGLCLGLAGGLLKTGHPVLIGVGIAIIAGVIIVAVITYVRSRNPQPQPTPTPDDSGRYVSYRELGGNLSGDKSKYNSPSRGPGQFRLDPDGVSTFELPGLSHSGDKPYAVPYTFVVSGSKKGKDWPIEGLPGCTATYTPEHGGPYHWSLNCTPRDETPNILSGDAKQESRTILNPGYPPDGVPREPPKAGK